MSRKSVLVTGANGYIGAAVANAFSRAGWKTFGLIRRREQAQVLAANEIHPVVGSPDDLSFLPSLAQPCFDVIVSNTEDWSDVAGHYHRVQLMLRELARRSQAAGVRPLVLFTSGCKDYGHMTQKHGDTMLAPHTEASPLNPPLVLTPRTDLGLKLLTDPHAAYDVTVLRPTIVYGRSSSHYGALFEQAATSVGTLRIVGDPDAVLHSLHVDDCGEAYVALAEHPIRDEVVQQAFNISNNRYETGLDVGLALARSYGLELAFQPADEDTSPGSFPSLTNFWQWVSSDKLRALTGWRERRTPFAQGIEEYRLAYEAARQAGSAA